MIDTITLNGVDYPVKFGLNTLRNFTKQFNISLTKLGNLGDMSLDVLLELMFAGLKDGARTEGQKLDLTIETFCDMFDGADMLDEKGKFFELLAIFSEQFGGGEESGNQEAPEAG